jgi:hypothetical protein
MATKYTKWSQKKIFQKNCSMALQKNTPKLVDFGSKTNHLATPGFKDAAFFGRIFGAKILTAKTLEKHFAPGKSNKSPKILTCKATGSSLIVRIPGRAILFVNFFRKATTIYPNGAPVSSVAGGDDTTRPRHKGIRIFFFKKVAAWHGWGANPGSFCDLFIFSPLCR